MISSPHAGALCVCLCALHMLTKSWCAMPQCCGRPVCCLCALTMCPRSSSQILKPTHTPGQPVHMQFSELHTRGPQPLNQRTLVSPEHTNASFLFAMQICQSPDRRNARGRLPGGNWGSGCEVVEPRRCCEGDQDGREHPQTSPGHPDGPQPGKELVQGEGVDQEQRGGRQRLAHLHHLLLILLWPLHS